MSLAACLSGVWLGPRIGFVDRPDGTALKPHRRPLAPLGGWGIFLGMHTGMAAAGIYDAGLAWATGVVFLLGLWDDRADVAPVIRLGVEVGAGIVLAYTARLPGDGLGMRVLAVVLVVAAINAVNLFDGLDGLVGSAAVVAGLGLWGVASVRNVDGYYGLVAAAAVAGFLVLNWRPARLFLGDSGAYVLGVVLAYGALVASPGGGIGRSVAAAGVLGVFAWDLAVTVLRRGRAGMPLFAGDRSHMYDQLADRGWSVATVALAAAAAEAMIVAAVIVLDGLLSPGATATAVAGIAFLLIAAAAAAGFLTSGRR